MRLLVQSEKEEAVPLRACDLLGDRAQGIEAPAFPLEAVIEHRHDDASVPELLDQDAARHRHARVVSLGHRGRGGSVQGDAVTKPRCILRDPNAKPCFARDGQGVLARLLGQTTLLARLQFPGDLPVQVLAMRRAAFLAEQLQVALLKLRHAHLREPADRRLHALSG